MGLEFKELDTLVTFLDNEKGAFWTTPEQIKEGRGIQTTVLVTNADGEQMEVSIHKLAMLSNLLTPVPSDLEHQVHPVAALNDVWLALNDMPFVGNVEAVQAFRIEFSETQMTVSLTLKNGNQQNASVTGGPSLRIFVLKCFSEIHPELSSGVGAWPGVATIEVDMETGSASINGLSPAPVPVVEKTKPAKKPRAARTPRAGLNARKQAADAAKQPT